MRAIVVKGVRATPSPRTSLSARIGRNRPRPGGQVLLRTLATAFNHMDLWVGRGVPGLSLTYPRVSGVRCVRWSERWGSGVDAAWVGQRVIVNAATIVPERGAPRRPARHHAFALDLRTHRRAPTGCSARSLSPPQRTLQRWGIATRRKQRPLGFARSPRGR